MANPQLLFAQSHGEEVGGGNAVELLRDGSAAGDASLLLGYVALDGPRFAFVPYAMCLKYDRVAPPGVDGLSLSINRERKAQASERTTLCVAQCRGIF